MPNKGQTKVTPKELKEKANEYLDQCYKNGSVPLFVEFAYLLGISDDTVTKYRNKPEFSGTLKRVEKAQEIALIKKGITDNKPVMSIFMLKAKHGYIEQQKLDVTTNGNPLGVVMLPNKQ